MLYKERRYPDKQPNYNKAIQFEKKKTITTTTTTTTTTTSSLLRTTEAAHGCDGRLGTCFRVVGKT